jgi:hypothetical protein
MKPSGFYVDPGSTLLVRPIKGKTLDNQSIIKGLKYPDPGSNRDGCYSTGV